MDGYLKVSLTGNLLFRPNTDVQSMPWCRNLNPTRHQPCWASIVLHVLETVTATMVMIALVSRRVETGDFVTILILKLASGRLHWRKLVAECRKTPAHFPSSMSLIPLEREWRNRL